MDVRSWLPRPPCGISGRPHLPRLEAGNFPFVNGVYYKQDAGRSFDAGDSRAETSGTSMAACFCADRLALLAGPSAGSGANSALDPEFFRRVISRVHQESKELVLSRRRNPVVGDRDEHSAEKL